MKMWYKNTYLDVVVCLYQIKFQSQDQKQNVLKQYPTRMVNFTKAFPKSREVFAAFLTEKSRF